MFGTRGGRVTDDAPEADLDAGEFGGHVHLPRRAKLHDKTGKWVVKQAAAEILPHDIVYAPKIMFRVPNRFSGGAERLLVGGMLPEMLGWKRNTTEEILNSLHDGGLRFSLVSLELWARIFFAGKSPASLGDQLAAFNHDAAKASP